jgi:autotransporter-associated beta strand protein
MKSLARNISVLTLLSTSGHATADVIYSGLQNITIPTTFGGTYIDVDGMTSSPSSFVGWDFNPFLGGVYLSNSAAFQPARDGTDGMDTVLNFITGATISATGLNFATGSGGSLDHLGTEFTADEEGYLGFKLGSNYGWMRVVFTNNAAGAKVVDWAYDNSGASGAIQTGNVLQSGSIVTLNSAFGSFALGSAITGGNSVIKDGANSTTLTNTSTYSGTTTVNNGKLIVNGSISTSSLTTVESGGTLGGTGTVGAAIVDGTLAVGDDGVGKLDFSNTLGLNGTSVMEIDGTAGAGLAGGNDFVNLIGAGAAGALTYGGAMTLDMNVLFGGVGTYSWNLFDMASETGTFTTISLTDQYSGSLTNNGFGVWALTSGFDTWTFTQSTGVLGLTVIPEPNVAALIGGFGMLCLLRRRR